MGDWDEAGGCGRAPRAGGVPSHHTRPALREVRGMEAAGAVESGAAEPRGRRGRRGRRQEARWRSVVGGRRSEPRNRRDAEPMGDSTAGMESLPRR